LVDIQSGQHFLETIPLRNLLPGEWTNHSSVARPGLPAKAISHGGCVTRL